MKNIRLDGRRAILPNGRVLKKKHAERYFTLYRFPEPWESVKEVEDVYFWEKHFGEFRGESTRLLRNIGRLITMSPGVSPDADDTPLAAIDNAAVYIEKGRIAWIGKEKDCTIQCRLLDDLEGDLCLPGFVDPHTHLVFAGNRSAEYDLRLRGASYVEILEAGGGILSTVEATRAASEETLFEEGYRRLTRMLQYGVTTCEAKSGYGLSVEAECKILRVLQQLDASHPVDIVPTVLAAHAIPREYRHDREAYLRLVLDEILPRVAQEGLAYASDVFCDRGAFTLEEARAVLAKSRELGLQIRIHAEEIESTGAAALAASMGALSADHLEKIDDAGIAALAASNTVAVLLPGTAVTLLLEAPPIDKLRKAGVRMALGTDLNPGTSYLDNLPLAASLGCGLFRLSVEEAILGITKHAAAAIGRAGQVGELRVGNKADLVAYRAKHENEIFYRFGQLAPRRVLVAGQSAWSQHQ